MNFASDITDKLQTPCSCCGPRHFVSGQDRLRLRRKCINPSISVTTTPIIISGGSGYTEGQYLTIDGGVADPIMLLYVSDVSDGRITDVILANSPVYSVLPPTAATSTALNGSGTGAVFSLGIYTCCVGQQSFGGAPTTILASSSVGQLIRSNNGGLTWSDIPGLNGFQLIYSSGLYWNGTLWVAVGASPQPSILYSYNAVLWQYATELNNFSNFQGNDVYWNDIIFIAVGRGYEFIYISPNGIEWSVPTVIPEDQQQLYNANGIYWNGSVWILVGNSESIGNYYGEVYIGTADGVTWTYVGNANTKAMYSIDDAAYDGTKWVICGQVNNNNNQKSILYSYGASDGWDWKFATGDLFTGNIPNIKTAVTWHGDKFVCAGYTNNDTAYTLIYSYDGITWYKTQGATFTDYASSVEWLVNQWVAIGRNLPLIPSSSFSTYPLYSKDGITWSTSSGIPLAFNGIPNINVKINAGLSHNFSSP